MKKYLSLLMALMMLVSLAACAGGGNGSSPAGSPASPAPLLQLWSGGPLSGQLRQPPVLLPLQGSWASRPSVPGPSGDIGAHDVRLQYRGAGLVPP